MICAHCKERDVNVEHVKVCSTTERLILVLDGATRQEPASLAQAPVEGVFFKEGSYFKVVQSANTGNWYAKEFVDGEWEYRGRKPLHNLTAEDRVSAEDAAKFGHVTGACVFCSRKLTDERSLTVGYGPVCAERESLPWGESVDA